MDTATTRAILIVDDEFGLAEMLRDVLAELGYEVTLAINGRLALKVLDERRIDLLLTDAMMPVMDGPELARVMRRDPRLRHIPIVMMTALPSVLPREEGLFEAVLAKPFTPDVLLTTVRSCLN